MTNRYPHLLEPIKISGQVFRNRIFSAPMGLHSMQDGRNYPTDAVIEAFANKARGGAAVVTCTGTSAYPVSGSHDGYHTDIDIYTGHNQKALAKLANAIHFYGAKASMEITAGPRDRSFDVSTGVDRFGNPTTEYTTEMIEEMIHIFGEQTKILRNLGFDMFLIHAGYRTQPAARFLSPISNNRNDKYGGSVENRARFVVEACDEIKRVCGRSTVIEIRMSGYETAPGGITLEDTIETAKYFEGHADIMHIHGGDGPDVTNMGSTHIMGFRDKYALLPSAEAVKKSGTSVKILAIGGFQQLDDAERVLADGKADIIGIARGIIADPYMVKKAYQGRPQDVVPCVRCMRCHDSSCFESRFLCTVNPTTGMELDIARMTAPKGEPKRIAVVGGGPAGMNAALAAVDCGHSVTLFEKGSQLGGQLAFADYVLFKSSLSSYKKFLVEQVGKNPGIEVRLNTEATPELIQGGAFDQVIAALGATPLVPPIPGSKGEKVITSPEVFGNENNLQGKIVVIGGGQVGCETAMHLATIGRDVTLIEMQGKLAPDASPTWRQELLFYMDKQPNLKTICSARCTGIGDTVDYADEDGNNHKLPADVVVMAAGMVPTMDEAMELFRGNYNTSMVGDCAGLGNVAGAVRTAYAAVSQI